MSHYQHNRLFDQPIFLSEEEMKDPYTVILEFFSDYRLGEIREINHNMVHVCLTSGSPPYQDASERDRLLEYRGREEKVLEAIRYRFHQ